MKGTKLGAVRAYWLGVVVCMAGFLFGYDSGIVGTYNFTPDSV